MLWHKIDADLFRPLCSPNSAVYATILWALYTKMVVHWFDKDDWTPKDCRDAIQKTLAEQSQSIDWTQDKLAFAQSDVTVVEDSDEASRIYRYFRSVGWLREIEEVGYRQLAYMPQQASGLLCAFNDLSRQKTGNIGARCQNVYLALQQAVDNPGTNALQIEIAADHAREFCTQLSTMAASCRELAHEILEETATAKVLARFFDDFVNGRLLEDYSKLKNRDHPYRFRATTIELIQRTLADVGLMEALVQGLMPIEAVSATKLADDKAQHRQQLRQNLIDIHLCFQRIDDIMQKIEHYRGTMTKRTREALQYAMTTPVKLAANIDTVIGLLAKNGGLYSQPRIAVPVSRHTHMGAHRHYRPRTIASSAQILPLVKSSIPQEQINFNQAMDLYYQRRIEDHHRLRACIEYNLGDQDQITTDDIEIGSLDDFMAYLQLRDLLNDAVPPSSPFYTLLDDFQVRAVKGQITINTYLIAPKLTVSRRRKSFQF